MRSLLFLIIIFVCVSCNLSSSIRSVSNTKNSSENPDSIPESSAVLMDSTQKDGIEKFDSIPKLSSVTVNYLAFSDTDNYSIEYSNNRILVTSPISEKEIEDRGIIDFFIQCINDFFIRQTEKIEYSRVKREDPIITDYSRLSFEIRVFNKQTINKTIQIGEEQYDITYNPRFLEFLGLIDSLVNDPRFQRPPSAPQPLKEHIGFVWDSLSIHCSWSRTVLMDNAKKELIIQNPSPLFEKHLHDKECINYIASCIDVFFVSKDEPVEYNRVINPSPVKTDYPSIEFAIYKEGEPIIQRSIQVGEESYIIKYNPKFLQFYVYLTNLTKPAN